MPAGHDRAQLVLWFGSGVRWSLVQQCRTRRRMPTRHSRTDLRFSVMSGCFGLGGECSLGDVGAVLLELIRMLGQPISVVLIFALLRCVKDSAGGRMCGSCCADTMQWLEQP